LTTLRTILRRINPFVNVFIRAADHFATNPVEEVHICIIAGRTPRNRDVRHYNVLSANDVAIIIPNKPGEVENRDVIV
jgi:hypothetical protein